MIKNKLSIMMGVRKMNMAELARLAGLSHVAVFESTILKLKLLNLKQLTNYVMHWIAKSKISLSTYQISKNF